MNANVLLVAAAAAVGYLAVRSRKKKKAPPAPDGTNGDKPVPSPTPTPTPGSNEYIGGKPYSQWSSHKNVFPTVESVMKWFANNGYPSTVTMQGPVPVTSVTKSNIMKFQNDSNKVGGWSAGDEFYLVPDGLIGNKTLAGMIRASEVVSQTGIGWQALVQNS